MRVLITGGSGYLGSVLVPSLISEGHEVNVMDIVPPVAGNWIKRDIFVSPITASDLRDTDAVIHLAALVGDLICHEKPQPALEVNYLATKYLSRACETAGVKLIFASTCSVYGVKSELCREDATDPEPFSIYGLTKLAAEKDVLKAHGTVFRMATIYGLSPKIRYNLVINEFVRGAKAEKVIKVFGGKQMRPFLEINSAARAYKEILKLSLPGEIFNLADENISLIQLGEMVRGIFGCRLNVIPEMADRRSYTVDFAKAVSRLNFRPTPLKEGIRAMKSLSV